MLNFPIKALSIRQPWAWAIIYAGKDIENRAWGASNFRGSLAIHAAKGMTRLEYLKAREFMKDIGVICPPAVELQRAGIIGTVEIIDFVRTSESPWFMGPAGLVLRDPKPCRFRAVIGALGFFNWVESRPPQAPQSLYEC